MKILAALTIFAALACSNVEVESESSKLGETFSLKANESKKMTDNQTSIEAKITKIADSRCPEGVQCIRAGEALVTLSLQIADEKFDNVNVCLQCEKNIFPFTETAEIKTKSKTYKLILQDVSPAPKATGTVIPAATMNLQ
jgi:formyltetrahydrofolate synthetase